MTDFEKTYQNYNPRQTALDEARALLTAAARAAMADGTLPEAELPAFIVEIPADVKNGDIASNIAMAGARTWRKAPKMIADALIAHLPALDGGVFAKVEVAGPGFINLFLAPSFWAGVVLGACSNKEYGRTDHGKGAKYNVEFVSANPTGPMHMGNARGGALGDCLAAVLDWSGYDVTREFYINDAGNQIQKFGKSLAVRYLQKYCGEEAYPLPAECYQGGDIKVLAGEFAEINGDKYVAACSGLDEEALFASEAFEALKNALVDYALPKNIAALKRDLGKYRIDYDVWFHESTLHESGAVLDVVNKLLELGACYKAEDGAIMYRSAQYAAKYGTVNKKKTEDGTEEEAKDEVLVRANGIPTYFAADIAYHYNPIDSNYDIYTRSGYASGSSADPRLHQTTLLMWSNYSDRAVDLGTIAAYDISPVMMELFGLRQPAYFQFLGRQLRAAYRANTRGTILEKDGTASNELTPLQQKWSDEHWLLQYDLMFGKGYALSRMGLESIAEGAD